MNIITVVVTLVSALIGLVLGYFAISLKMKSAKETAELTLLNAEQEASNVRGRAEEQAEVILKTAERDRQTLKKNYSWKLRKKLVSTEKKLQKNLSQNVKS